MPHFAVTLAYAPGSEAARAELREQHLAFLDALQTRGLLLASGPLGTEGEPGALMIIAGPDDETTELSAALADVAATLADEPFFANGLIIDRQIRSWKIVFGSVGDAS